MNLEQTLDILEEALDSLIGDDLGGVSEFDPPRARPRKPSLNWSRLAVSAEQSNDVNDFRQKAIDSGYCDDVQASRFPNKWEDVYDRAMMYI